MAKNHIKISIILFFCAFVICFISKELLNFNRIYEYELYGFSHLDNYFIKVCDFSNVFKKFGITNNVSPTREDSFIFTIPSKLFYNFISPRVTHRLIVTFLYSIFVFSSAFLFYFITNSLLTTLFALSYTVLFSQFLSYYFQFKLSLTSITLTSVIFLVVYLFHISFLKNKKISILYVLILPFLLINMGYEAFCISRPINVVIYFFIFIYLLLFCSKKHITFFLIATFFSIFLLKITNPTIKFDSSVFIARGEGLVVNKQGNFSLLNFNDMSYHIGQRLKELPNVFTRPNDFVYKSQTLNFVGNLDVMLGIFVITMFLIILYFTNLNKSSQKLMMSLKSNSFMILFCVYVLIISLIVPNLSTKFIRGHRLLGFYFSSIVLFIILFQIFIDNFFEKSQKIKNSILTVMFLLVFYYKFNIFINYDFNRHNVNMNDQVCLDTISKLTNEAKNINKVGSITICDLGDKKLYEPSWNGILYLSGLACKRTDFLNPVTIVKADKRDDCECSKNKNDICLVKNMPCDIELISY